MRNYIQTILKEALPSNIAIVEECLQSRLSFAAAHNINSIRGTVNGDGDVQNSFVLGTVTVAKGAVVANCIIDANVILIVDEGVRISDCSFHPTLLDSKIVPVIIKIGKNSTLFYVWSADSFTCGQGDILMYSIIHEMGNMYGALQGEPVVFGDNCVLYGSLIDSNDVAEAPKTTRIMIGDNAIIWQGGLIARRCNMTIAEGLVVCDNNIALKLKHGKLQAIKSTDSTLPDIVSVCGGLQVCTRLDVCGVNLRAGKNLYVSASIGIQHAFDKLKDGVVQLGDNVNMIQQQRDDKDDRQLQINVHQFLVGNNVTLVCDVESWYSSRDPERRVEIGDDCTVILTTSNNGFKGLDKKVPSNSIVTL